jgi:hypothetical protein
MQLMQEDQIVARARRRILATQTNTQDQDMIQKQEPEFIAPAPTGKVFLNEEDKRLLKKFNQHIVNKLGLGGNRSIKL